MELIKSNILDMAQKYLFKMMKEQSSEQSSDFIAEYTWHPVVEIIWNEGGMHVYCQCKI